MGLVPDDILQKDAFNVNIDITIIERGIPVDLSTVTQKNIIIRKPSGVKITAPTVFITSGIDGKIRYITVSGDLDELGEYFVQADLIFLGGYDGPTDIGSFWVANNL